MGEQQAGKVGRSGRRWARAALVGALGLTALGQVSCSSAFEPESAIQSLRVLGVRVDQPYAKPGTKVRLDMLYFDGSRRAFDAQGKRTREVSVLWIGGCHDPAGDLYYGCFPILAQQFAQIGGGAGAAGSAGAPAGGPPGGPNLLDLIGTGSSFQLAIPEDIISRKPAAEIEALKAQGNTPYGLSYVFYAVCGGDIKQAAPGQTKNGLPLACFDKQTGEQLGDDDFVIGYTPIYTYDAFSNKNPVIDGLTFEGARSMNVACSDKTPCAAGTTCGSQGVCIPVVPYCTERKQADCPTYEIKPVMSPDKNVELDSAAPPDSSGRTPEEVIWVAYYVSDGTVDQELKLVNDANKGWNSEQETKWSAPNAPAGESRVWVVAHDNRGGTAWTWQDIMVK
jgi:hypothetical protein